MTKTMEENIRNISDERLWKFRVAASKSLVEYARERLSRQLEESGATPEIVENTKILFDPDTLTLGFARRFATYKRPNLLLHDPERLFRMLTNTEHPVQLIIAGKAHPEDKAGQDLIEEWTRFIKRPEVRHHAVFLSDYDMHLTEHLVQGVDVWINTPRRPWEASGTSGMKVLVNGGINLSVLDGWWAEAYTPEVGWALGDGKEHGDDPYWDNIDADSLYNLLEQEVIPEFYDRNKKGIPQKWVKRMRESMALLTPKYSANRTVREYTEQHYIPLASEYNKRAANKGSLGGKILNWRKDIEQKWETLHFGKVNVETKDKQHIFEVEVYLNEIIPDMVCVELYAEGINGSNPVRQEMKCKGDQSGNEGLNTYRSAVSSNRPASDFTARVISNYDGVAVPLENNKILWQH
jgi:starch phosphorylase